MTKLGRELAVITEGTKVLSEKLGAVDALLHDLRRVLKQARIELRDDDRRDFAREARKRVACAVAEVDWIVLGRLSRVDTEVLSALLELEPARGSQFRTTGNEIWQRTSGISFSVVYVSLRRLAYLRMIDREAGAGNRGTRIRILWSSTAQAA